MTEGNHAEDCYIALLMKVWKDGEVSLVQHLVQAWNQRAERTCHGDMDTDYYSGKLDRFSCSNCGIEWAVDDGMAPTTKVSYCPNCGAKVVE